MLAADGHGVVGWTHLWQLPLGSVLIGIHSPPVDCHCRLLLAAQNHFFCFKWAKRDSGTTSRASSS